MTDIISRFSGKGRAALTLVLPVLSALALGGIWGVLDSLAGGDGLVPVQVGVLGVSSLACLWGSVNLASGLLAPGAVYVRSDQLFVAGVLCRQVPLMSITGFRTEPAPTGAFRSNVDLIVECRDRAPIRIHSAFNTASLDEIRRALAFRRLA